MQGKGYDHLRFALKLLRDRYHTAAMDACFNTGSNQFAWRAEVHGDADSGGPLYWIVDDDTVGGGSAIREFFARTQMLLDTFHVLKQ